MVRDRIKDPNDLKAFDLIMSQQEYGRPFAMPPEVPADRVQAFRAAFNATMKDPEFPCRGTEGSTCGSIR